MFCSERYYKEEQRRPWTKILIVRHVDILFVWRLFILLGFILLQSLERRCHWSVLDRSLTVGTYLLCSSLTMLELGRISLFISLHSKTRKTGSFCNRQGTKYDCNVKCTNVSTIFTVNTTTVRTYYCAIGIRGRISLAPVRHHAHRSTYQALQPIV